MHPREGVVIRGSARSYAIYGGFHYYQPPYMVLMVVLHFPKLLKPLVV